MRELIECGRYIFKWTFDSDGESEPIHGILDDHPFVEKMRIEGVAHKNGVPFILPLYSEKGDVCVYLKKEGDAYRMVRKSSGEFSDAQVVAYVRYTRPLDTDKIEAGE